MTVRQRPARCADAASCGTLDYMADQITVAQVAYDLRGAADTCGVGITTIKQAIADGDLVAHYAGRGATKPIIRAVELDAWVASLPTTRHGEERGG